MTVDTDANTGITFRHQQNASINATMEKGKFYGYRDTFIQNAYFLPIPSTCEYLDDEIETKD